MKFKVGDRVYFNDTHHHLGVITSIHDNRWWVTWLDKPELEIPYHSWRLVHSDFVDYYHDFFDKIKDRLS